MASVLPAPSFQLIYRGVDISGDIDPLTTSITYTDHLHGKADEIDITVHDKDGRWKGAWMPTQGDVMVLVIKDGRGGVLPAGVFQLDEPTASGGRDGDYMSMRGLAVPITKALRTKKTKAFENQSTQDIVSSVAGDLGMQHQGDVADLTHKRVTQRRERPLEFLKRLAEETGHYFNVKDSEIVFTTFASIDGLPPFSKIYHGDRKLIDYDFRFQSDGTYSKGEGSYLDERKAKTTKHEETDPQVTNGETLRVSGERMESPAHAEARVKSEMHMKNRRRFSGSVTTVGTPSLLAGTTVLLSGFGAYSGVRLINSSTHSLGRDGYTTSAELVDARK